MGEPLPNLIVDFKTLTASDPEVVRFLKVLIHQKRVTFDWGWDLLWVPLGLDDAITPDSPAVYAETFFREVVGKSSFTSGHTALSLLASGIDVTIVNTGKTFSSAADFEAWLELQKVRAAEIQKLYAA